jgi:hypothetical protein
MKRCNCAICLKLVDEENAPILTMSGAGVPRYLCEECEVDVAAVSDSLVRDEIADATKRILSKITENNIDDPVTMRTVTDILKDGANRATAIEDGSYNTESETADSEESEILEEIPEDLLETDEDRALDEAEEEKFKKIDKVLSWIWGIAIVAIVGLMAWWLFF